MGGRHDIIGKCQILSTGSNVDGACLFMSSQGDRSTTHRTIAGNSQTMNDVETDSVDLVVTSPPYPMVEMWDETFAALNPDIADAIADDDGTKAFYLMHAELGKTWEEVVRVLKKGAIACINIGDATRTVGGSFRKYSNHSRVTSRFEEMGMISLPSIIWRKPTNAPNKFMGSGMLPPGAYVTLEHEHILIFRKGARRTFDSDEGKALRSESSYFWEERNVWFSDVWTDLLGANQRLDGNHGRQRSGAFPFELPYRLINMFSIKDDLVLDPFLGTGTTTLAAIASGRNSIGYEIDDTFVDALMGRVNGFLEFANEYIETRVARHLEFSRIRACEFVNEAHGFGCTSSQETAIRLERLDSIDHDGNHTLTARYRDLVLDR